MAIATDQQCQSWSDQVVRPLCEALRKVKLKADDANARVSDVYEALTQASPTWNDNRGDGPPHLLTPADVLSVNTICAKLAAILNGDYTQDADKIAAVNDLAGQWPVVLKACVQPVAQQ